MSYRLIPENLNKTLEKLDDTIAELNTISNKLEVVSNKLDSLLNELEKLTKALESSSQDSLLAKLLDIDTLLRSLLNTPFARTAITGSGQLRTAVENITTSWVSGNVPTSGAPTIGSVNWATVWIGPVDQRWMIIQMANIEYNECQRSKFAFV